MCGGFVGDLLDDVGDVLEDVGDFIGDTVEAVVDNPLGAIVSVGGMALGIPPVWAGALGGAANAAANDGNILEGALLGGATGYVGGVAGQAAASAGAGNILAGAAGGAAAGAAGAALTGQNIIRGALMGGTLGAGTGALYELYQDVNGNKVYKYDDGSTITRDGSGNAVGSTPATDGSQAPVMEYNPSTGRIETFNPDGSLNILSIEETNALMAKIDPNLLNNLVDTGEVFRVEVEGLPGTAENASYAKGEFRTPGTELATFDQIDAGQATWNPAANAWEVGATGPQVPIDDLTGAVNMGPGNTAPAYTGPDTYTFDDGSTFTIQPDGTTSFTDATTGSTSDLGGGGTVQAGSAGGATYTFDDGTWLTINPDGSSVWTDTNGGTHTSAGGTYAGAGTGGVPTDMGEIEITAPRDPVTDLGEIEITAPREPVVTPGGGTTPVTPGAGGTIPYNPGTGGTTPVTPVFPVIPGGTGGGGAGGGGTTPTTPVGPAPTSNLQTNWGLNPGWIAPTPFYNTTDPVQSQFFWGSHPFQAGPTFNSTLYNQAAAPQTPWGIQQGFEPLTPAEAVAASRGEYEYQPAGAPAVRVTPFSQAAMTAPTRPASTPTVGSTFTTPGMGNSPINNLQLAGSLDQSTPRAPVNYVTGPAVPQTVVGPSPTVVGPGPSPFVAGPAQPPVGGYIMGPYGPIYVAPGNEPPGARFVAGPV